MVKWKHNEELASLSLEIHQRKVKSSPRRLGPKQVEERVRLPRLLENPWRQLAPGQVGERRVSTSRLQDTALCSARPGTCWPSGHRAIGPSGQPAEVRPRIRPSRLERPPAA